MAEMSSGSLKGNLYKPFVSADMDMKELTFKAIFLGIILAVVLAPWLERFYQRAVKHDDEDEKEE